MRKPFAITLDAGSSRANHTGAWRTERPVYVDNLPPCNSACPAGENIQQWQLLRLRQLLRRLPGQRDRQARRRPVRDRLRLLQGLRPVRRRMPLRRHRDGTRTILKVRIPPRHDRLRRFT